MAILTVNVNLSSGAPTVDLPSVNLQAGDQVVWSFPDLPTGSVGGIHFETPVGPFHSIRLFGSRTFVGKGNVGLPQGVSAMTYPYRVQIVDVHGSRAVSQGTLPTITNLCQLPDTSPEVVVQCIRQPSGLLLNVQPETLFLNTGDTATWHIFGLPPDHFVTLLFPTFATSTDPLLGPFKSVFWSQAVTGDDPNEIRGSAMDFKAPTPEPDSLIMYSVQVRSADGQIVAQEDPLIDNLGDPPTGGG